MSGGRRQWPEGATAGAGAEGVKDNREVHEREPRKKDATEGVMTKIARRSKEGPARAREQGRADAGGVTQPRTTGCRHAPCTADEEDEVRRGERREKGE